jgi:hypothetical protein
MKPPAAFAEAPRFSARERRAPVLGKRALRDSRRVKGGPPNAFAQTLSPLNPAGFPATGWRAPRGLPIWRETLGFRRRPDCAG